jgi:hypothetical protein
MHRKNTKQDFIKLNLAGTFSDKHHTIKNIKLKDILLDVECDVDSQEEYLLHEPIDFTD